MTYPYNKFMSPGASPITNQVLQKPPIIARLIDNKITVALEGINLLCNACLSSTNVNELFTSWKVQAYGQLYNAISTACPGLIEVDNYKLVVRTIDRMESELGLDPQNITAVIFHGLWYHKSSAIRGRTKEALLKYLNADDTEEIDALIEGRQEFQCSSQANWTSPGYLRLREGDEGDYLQLLRLLLVHLEETEDKYVGQQEVEREIQVWKNWRWTKTMDWYDYMYGEEERFTKVESMCNHVVTSPPTTTERITKLVSGCQTHIIERFSERVRRTHIDVHRLTWAEAKKELYNTVTEHYTRLPWEREETDETKETAQSNTRSNRPTTHCDYCRKEGHMSNDCWKKKKAEPGYPSTGEFHKPNIAETNGKTLYRNPYERRVTFNDAEHTPEKRSLDRGKDQEMTKGGSLLSAGYMTRSRAREIDASCTVQQQQADKKTAPTFMTTIGNKNKELPKFSVIINEHQWDVIVDSASAVNFMNDTDWADLGIEGDALVGPDRVVLRGVHGGQASYNRKVKLPLNVEDKTLCYLNVLVGPAGLATHTIILGWPSMKRMGVRLTPNQIVFDAITGATFTLQHIREDSNMSGVYKVDIAELPPYPIVPQTPVHVEIKQEDPRIRTRGYRLSAEQSQIMDDLLDDFIHQGILRECEGPQEEMHVSPGFLTEKKVPEGEPKKYRLLVDLRRLNARIKVPSYEIHAIAEFYRTPQNHKFFATFDVKNAYYTRMISEDSSRLLTMKTSSVGGWRYTQWTKLPQGLSCSPQYWCDRIDSLRIAYNSWLQEVIENSDQIEHKGRTIKTRELETVLIRCYIDDGLVSGETEDAVNFVAETFQEVMNLNGHPVHKVTQANHGVDLLGLHISAEGWRMSDEHTKKLLHILSTAPTSNKELQSLLGSLVYCRTAFDCRNPDNSLSALASPLFDKLRGEQSFEWTSEDQQCLERIADAYSNLPLKHLAEIDDFIAGKDAWVITSDASNVAAAGVLYRVDLTQAPADYFSKEFHDFVSMSADLIDTWSSRFSDVETRWPVHEREGQALVKSITRWGSLIYGTFRHRSTIRDDDSTAPHVILLTDNSTTLGKFLKSMAGELDDMSMVKCRKWYGWYSEVEPILTAVPVVATHIRGTGNVLADLLSRKSFGNTVDVQLVIETNPLCIEHIAELQASDTETSYQGISISEMIQTYKGLNAKADSTKLKKMKALMATRFEWEQETLWIRFPDLAREGMTRRALVVPRGILHANRSESENLDPDEKIQNENCETNEYNVQPDTEPRTLLIQMAHDKSGHPGADKVITILNNMGVWWPGMLNDVKQYISKCATCGLTRSKEVLCPLNPNVVPFVHRLKYISVDFVGPLEAAAGGERYIFTIVERYTGFCLFIPITGEPTAALVAELIWTRWVAVFGRVSAIHSDCGPQFTSELMRRLAELTGVELTFSPPYYKPANGQVERCHSTLKRVLRVAKVSGADWPLHVPVAQLLLNETPRGQNLMPPAVLMFGVKTNNLISFDVNTNVGSGEENGEVIKKLATIYEEIRKDLKMRMIDESTPDINVEPTEVGDFVYWFNDHEPMGKGPYKVTETTPTRAKIVSAGKEHTVHRTQLKPYKGPVSNGPRTLKPGELVIFHWQDNIAVVGKILNVPTEGPILCHEYEGGCEDDDRGRWWPLWTCPDGSVKRSIEAPRGSQALTIECNREDLLVNSSWTLTRRNEIPHEIRRLTDVQY